MRFTDEAVILSTAKFSESSLIVTMLTASSGICRGMAKGVHSKTNRGTFLEGNVVSATWSARLSEQLGTISAELTSPVAAMVMSSSQQLLCLRSAVNLVSEALPEREPHKRFYSEFKTFLGTLSRSDIQEKWLSEYVILEMSLLRELGFGLDLSECAATGTSENLIYVSPKSGRAVSAEAGEPYKDKLFKLPPFILSVNAPITLEHIKNGLLLTGYFLEKSFSEIRHKSTPTQREAFVQSL